MITRQTDLWRSAAALATVRIAYRFGRVAIAGVLWLSISARADAQSEERQLRDLFNLQWIQATQGRPEGVTAGAPGQFILNAAVSTFLTTNPQLLPEGSPADFYVNPWASAEWRMPIARTTNWYLGGAFVDYRYLRYPELNYAFVKVWTGLSTKLAKGELFAVDGYVTAAFDYDLTSRFSSDDFEFPLSMGLIVNADLGWGHSVYLTPECKVMGALPSDSASKSYVSQSVTTGWTWQISPAVSCGAYWSGAVHHYPIDLDQTDFTQYLGATCDWQITPALALSLAGIQTFNASSEPASRYSDFSASLTLKVGTP